MLKAGVKDPDRHPEGGRRLYRDRLAPRRACRSTQTYKGDVAGPVTVQYVETFDDGSHVIAETQAVLR